MVLIEMQSKGAVTAVLVSAILMGGVYAWRWLTGRGKLPTEAKLSAAKLIGYGPQVSPEGFLIAWGIVYGGLALVSTLAPGFAGSLALLILLTGMIANFGSASETAQALVKAKTGTTPAGPEVESSEGLPPGATAGLEGGFSGGLVPFTTGPARTGEHVPTKLPPAPNKIKLNVKPAINWKRLEEITRSGGPKGHLSVAAVRKIIKGEMSLKQAEISLGL